MPFFMAGARFLWGLIDRVVLFCRLGKSDMVFLRVKRMFCDSVVTFLDEC